MVPGLPSTSSWSSCPTTPERSTPCAVGFATSPAAGVEVVTEVPEQAMDREGTVLAAAAGILQAATPVAVLRALSGRLRDLFDLEWLALADDV